MDKSKLAALRGMLKSDFLHWRADVLPDEAEDYFRHFHTNTTRDIYVYSVEEAVRQINAMIPPMDFGLLNGEPNPNNGHPHHWYSVGRENSEVLYLHIVKSYLPRSYDYATLAVKLGELGRAMGADENDATETETRFEFRFWWD